MFAELFAVAARVLDRAGALPPVTVTCAAERFLPPITITPASLDLVAAAKTIAAAYDRYLRDTAIQGAHQIGQDGPR